VAAERQVGDARHDPLAIETHRPSVP
jgi:hypothetical protein